MGEISIMRTRKGAKLYAFFWFIICLVFAALAMIWLEQEGVNYYCIVCTFAAILTGLQALYLFEEHPCVIIFNPKGIIFDPKHPDKSLITWPHVVEIYAKDKPRKGWFLFVIYNDDEGKQHTNTISMAESTHHDGYTILNLFSFLKSKYHAPVIDYNLPTVI